MRIIARSNAVDAADMAIARVDAKILRQARVRLDAVAMLLYQAFFASSRADLEEMDVFLFVDGSPQWRGRELYASTMDLLADGFYKRVLLPLLFLGQGSLDTIAKTVGLLWQVMLLTGANHLQALLGRVRAVLTDGGTERKIVTAQLTLDDFLVYQLQHAAWDGAERCSAAKSDQDLGMETSV